MLKMKLSRPRSREKSLGKVDKLPAKTYLARQREKAVQIQNNMTEEISKIFTTSEGKGQQHERVNVLEEYKLRKMICSEALDQIIELHSEICNLLSEIRCEYEGFLNALTQGEIQYDFIYEQLKKITTDPITLALLRKRRDELERKIALLNESNQKIATQLLKIEESNKIHNQKACDQNMNNKNGDSGGKQECDKGLEDKQKQDTGVRKGAHSVIGVVSLSGATDTQKLLSYSSKLQNTIHKISKSLKNQYTSKAKQNKLKEQFCKKENIQHHLLLYNSRLKERFENLKISIESLKKDGPSDKPISMLGMVTKTLDNHREKSAEQLVAHTYSMGGIFEDDDPARKRNEERLMEYMDIFNEMISAKEYDQAAKHAANSPKAILRTYEVMKIFKDIEDDANGQVSPQMLFCEALMATADSASVMSGALSCEIMKCALVNQNIELASYWLSKACFKLSLPMANIFLDFCKCEAVCTCGSMVLAKEIFHKLGAHRQASLCLLSTEKIHQMIQYGEDHDFNVHDYVYLCKRCPSTKLLLFLVSAHPEVNIAGLISFPYAVSVLLDSKNSAVLSEVLQQVHKQGIVSIDSSRKTFTELLFGETKEDCMSPEKWRQIVDFCSAENLGEIAEDLLAVLVVRQALDTAAYKCVLDYIS